MRKVIKDHFGWRWKNDAQCDMEECCKSYIGNAQQGKKKKENLQERWILRISILFSLLFITLVYVLWGNLMMFLISKNFFFFFSRTHFRGRRYHWAFIVSKIENIVQEKQKKCESISSFFLLFHNKTVYRQKWWNIFLVLMPLLALENQHLKLIMLYN